MRIVWMLFLAFTFQGLIAQSSSKYIKQVQQDSFTLYFALPVSMKAGEARVEFEPDFTYHAYEEAPERDQVTMNFSLFSKQDPVKKIDRIDLKAGKETFSTQQVEFLYLKKNGKKWHARFTAMVPVAAYQAVLKHAEHAAFYIHTGEKHLVFPSNKKWKKSAEIVGEYLANQ